MTIYEPNPDVRPVGVEFEEFADVPILAEDRPPPPISDEDTPLPNHLYALVSMLHQARADVARHTAFESEARAAGDAELADWCRDLADADRQKVARARSMVAARLPAA